MNSRRLFGLVVLASFFYSFIGFRCGINVYDEGLIAYGAERILRGDIPYKDFWLGYAPGQYWLVAGLFKLFGPSLMIGRFLSVIAASSVSVVVYIIAGKLSSYKTALMPWLLSLLWINTYGFLSPMPVSLLFSLISSLSLLNFLFTQDLKYLAFSGFFSAVSLLFRHDIGLLTLAAEGLVIFLSVYFNSPDIKKGRLNRLCLVLRPGIYYLTAWLVIILPVGIYLITAVPLKDLIEDLVIFPLKIYPQKIYPPWPALLPNPAHVFLGVITSAEYFWQCILRVAYYFPLFAYLFTLMTVIVKTARGKFIPEAQIRGVILFIFLGMMFFYQASLRAALSHLRPTFMPALILFSFLIYNLKLFKRAKIVSIIAVIVILAMGIIPLSEKIKTVSFVFSSPFSFTIERAKGISSPGGRTYQDLVKYIQENVAEGEKIYVGNWRHDKLSSSDSMLYFLSGRESATKFSALEPGITNTKPVQEQIISGIQKHNVRHIVTYVAYNNEPDRISERGGVFLLDDFIRKAFVPIKQFGVYTVWRKI